MESSSFSSIEWLTRLIVFDTTSRNSNLDIIYAIQDALAAYPIESRLTQDASGKKANLFATIPADDGSITNGIILSGHTDVVPVDGQSWNTNPFIATQIDDRIYGRGACDMKGFIAVILALIPEFFKRKRLKPIHLAFSYDEEIGCLGAPLLIEDLQKYGIQPEACVVGEPTSMQPVVAHKGIHVFRCRINGCATHSSLTTKGCNAIEYATDLICYIRSLAEKFQQQGPFDHYYDVPFTTLTTNLIQGGNAINTIPALCEFFFEFRHLPENNPHSLIDLIQQYIDHHLLPKMRLEYPQATITLESIADVPGLESKEDENIIRVVRALTEDPNIKRNSVSKVSYATEAGLFQHAGIPTVICGPGNIAQAHGPNEFIEISQLQKCEEFLLGLIDQF